MRFAGRTALAAVVVCTAAIAADADKPKKQAGTKETVWAADEVKFSSLPGMPSGVKKSPPLWGDESKAHASFTRFDAGYKVPLHFHSLPLRVVVIKGTFLYQPEGGEERKLEPGSYLLEPAGQKHTTACAAGTDCVFLEEMNGKFDIKMADAKSAGK